MDESSDEKTLDELIGEFGVWERRNGRWEPTTTVSFKNGVAPFDPNAVGPIQIVGRYQGQPMIFPLQVVLGGKVSPFDAEVRFGNGKDTAGTCTFRCTAGIWVPYINHCKPGQIPDCSSKGPCTSSNEGQLLPGNCKRVGT